VQNHHATTVDGLEMGCYQGHYNGRAALVSYHPTAPLQIAGCGGEITPQGYCRLVAAAECCWPLGH